jgi:hypothetical protein
MQPLSDGRWPLRDGSATEDRSLDRLIQFDERSRNYPIRELLPKAADRLKTRTHALKVRLDQGQQGACVLFGWSHEVAASPVPGWGLGSRNANIEQAARDATAFARERYVWAQMNDEWPGGEYPGADPQYGGTSVLAGAKAMVDAGYLGEYRWGFSIDDLLATVSHIGPVVVGTWWLSGMWNPDPKTGLVNIEGDKDGGHGYCVRGIVVPKDGKAKATILGKSVTIKTDVPLLRVPNSWGSGWGLGGECFMRADDFEAKLLKDDGECCVPVRRLRPVA